jgi:lysophospholipase L1-like esterase
MSDLTAPSALVTYPQPTTSDGSPPVSTACTPASNTQFPLGETKVTCTATDTISRQATCSFTVTLNHRVLALTKYLAFGDSITEGENGRPINGFRFTDVANAYPTKLQQLFDQRMPGKGITVFNWGLGGESVTNNEARLKQAIAETHAEVMLLLEGINDLNGGTSPDAVTTGLRNSIGTAKERGVQYVFVSTILPLAPENCGAAPPPCRAFFTTNDTISATNARIRSMVPANGATLVDTYDLFFANRTTYVDIDGLHLRPAGNQALADAFWDRLLQVIPPKQLFGF